MAEKFEKHLTVDKKIVPLLSRSTYVNFPTALRELISNAYDADATEVKIELDLNKGTLTIKDDGSGMTPEEFGLYLKIAGRKRTRGPKTPKFGRMRIGQFGIGFLSAFPYCQTLRITSTAEGSPEVFTADIPASKFFALTKLDEDVSDIPVTGSIRENPQLKRQHYTEIRLINTTSLVSRYLRPPKAKAKRGRYTGITINELAPLERLRWELQEDLPIPFAPKATLEGLWKNPNPVPFNVLLNKKILHRNDSGNEILAKGSDTVGEIRYSYAITSPWKPIHPREARWIKLRLNDVGVGPRTDFDAQLSRQSSRAAWLSGELHILSGMGDSIQLDRNGFIWSQDFEDLQLKMRKLIAQKLQYLEDIDTSTRKIESQISKKIRAKVGEAKHIIEENVEVYKKHGFEIVEGKRPQKLRVGKAVKRASGSSIEVDTKGKKVYVNLKKETLQERTRFGNVDYEVTYSSWDHKKGPFPACRLKGKNHIEINTNHPLFKSSRYGNIFKMIFLILVHGTNTAKTPREMHDIVTHLIGKQFSFYS